MLDKPAMTILHLDRFCQRIANLQNQGVPDTLDKYHRRSYNGLSCYALDNGIVALRAAFPGV
jgi:hypothetical protein